MITSVYEKKKIKRLNEKNLVIETLYYNPNANVEHIYVRTTDGKKNEEIYLRPIKEKRYFLNNECIFVDNNFNKDCLYTIKNYEDENEKISCPNCGNEGKVSEFIDRCPYCKTIFNFGINNTNNSKNRLSYKYNSNGYYKYYLIIYLITTIILAIFFSLFTDSFISALFISSFFSPIPALIINVKLMEEMGIIPIVAYDESEDTNWKSTKDKTVFYNNLKAELMIKFYEKEDLVDFEINSYEKLDFLSDEKIKVICKIKETYFKDEIYIIENIYEITLHYNNIKTNDEDNIVYCVGCGKSINITQTKCNFCGRINNYRHEWIIDNIKIIEDIDKEVENEKNSN